jgi:Kdo2-lipid IVA lauroyltransferase/acyltransferase
MKAMAMPARILFFLASTVGALPLGLQRRLGRMLGWIFYRLNTRAAMVARRNFEYTQLVSEQQRETWVREVMQATGQNLVETLRVWTRDETANLALIKNVHGLEILEAAQAQKKGVIIAAPHYGNWELLIEYMAARGLFALVYRMPEKKWGDDFLRRARGGENVLLVPAETNAMRPLWKTLQSNGVVGITPDQQPKLGGGEFAAFFSRQALSLSLIPKLAERSEAAVVFAYTEACAEGFDVYFEAADPEIASKDLQVAITVMNRQVENIARRDLRQYQWTYKRYTIRPENNENSEDVNPYWPDCY